MLRLGGGGLLLLALLCGAAVAWLGSADGVRWLAARSAIRLQSVQGTLWSGLRVGTLQWQDASIEVRAQGVLLRWQPRALLRARPLLHLRQLRVERLVVLQAHPDSAVPARHAPPDLLVPLDLRIDQLRIGAVELRRPGQSQALDLGGLQASLLGDARRWLLRMQWRGPWGPLRAVASLQARAPYALRGRIDGVLHWQQRALALRARLGGTLPHTRLRVLLRSPQSAQARGRVRAELHPFDRAWLHALQLRAQGLDPGQFDPGWPRARLTLDAELRAASDGGLQGHLALRNTASGSLDAQRLPLQALRSKLELRHGVLQAEDLRVALAGNGFLDGQLRWPLGGRAALQLQVQALDLHALYARLAPTRLQGSLDAQGDAAAQRVDLALAQPAWTLDMQARHDATGFVLRRATLLAHAARVELQGRLGTGAGQPFSVHARVRNLRPERFGRWPRARLSLQLRAQGSLDRRALRFALQLQPSRWRGSTLLGQARGRIDAQGLRDLQAALRLGSNSLQAHGGFPGSHPGLRLVLRAPRLDQLGPGWAGQIDAQALLQGPAARPAGQLWLQARGLRGPRALRLQSLQATVDMPQGWRGALHLGLHAAGLGFGRWHLSEASLQLQGTLRAQQIRLQLRQPQGLQLRARARGGWRASSGWSGRIEALRNSGRYAFRMQAPATLRIGPGADFDLRNLDLRSVAGSVLMQSVRHAGSHWHSQGQVLDLDPAYWLRAAGVELPDLRSSLRLDASWALRSAPQPQLQLLVQRRSGDLGLGGEQPLDLGLSALRLQVHVADARLQARFHAAGSHLGSVQAQAEVALGAGAGGWGVAPDAALQGSARLRMPDIAWADTWLPRHARVGGSLQAALRLHGTAAAPALDGRFRGSALSLALPQYGLDLRGGTIDAVLAGPRLQLRSLLLHDASGAGALRASGSLALSGRSPDGSVDIQLQHLRVLDRPGEELRLSGEGRLQGSRGGVGLDARLHVDSARIELAGGDAPRLASDVVVEGRTRPAAGPPAMPLRAVVRVDLGQHFVFRGHGVHAQLGGALLLRADAGQPLRAEGSIVVRSGSYSAYGQQLRLVEGGSVNFSGPVDNPGLNLSAQRDHLPVQVGVRISGTLRTPQVVLTSTPIMPESSILSWLVLGQDPSTLSADQTPMLQAAAVALLSRGQSTPLTERVAHALGLDQLSVGGQGGLQNSVLTIGKNLSSRLSVSVERGLAAAGALFDVRYQLSPRLSLRLQSGTDNAVDLFYLFRFD